MSLSGTNLLKVDVRTYNDLGAKLGERSGYIKRYLARILPEDA